VAEWFPRWDHLALGELMFGTYRVIHSVKDQVDILTVRHSSQLLRMSELGDDET